MQMADWSIAYARVHGIKEFRYPNFSSAVILEKLKDSQNRFYVTMLAWTGDDDNFLPLKLGNYKEYCPIEEYLKIVEDVIPSKEEMNSFYEACNMALASDLKLELVQVLFRHGARTNAKSEVEMAKPQNIDPSLHETFGYEQLTNVGRAQAYNLGLKLRDRYDNFLGPLYKPDDVYAYSSYNDRTKMSLQLVLAGLYPPTAGQIWNENLRWQPIPTYYVPQKADVLLKANEMHKYNSLLSALKKTPRYKEAEKTCMRLNDFMLSKGVDALQRYGLFGNIIVYNILYSHKASKGKLPDWYTDDLFEEFKKDIVLYFNLTCSTPELCKWQIGPLVRRFLDNMNVKAETTNPRKIYLYGGHELNIVAYVIAHGIQEFRYPDFSSAVILEKLRDSQNRLYVRMLAWTGNNDTFLTLKLGNGKEYCPIEEYTEIVKDVLPSDAEINSMYDDIPNGLSPLHSSDVALKS
ncbi:venom acid phosphatase Acph-1 isoform X2 [Nasonia vitripennis]|uniref:Venom acid phosphatase Acph-1 n=1 Tax=Nasonia vitripennis TaxID=7425 RepID=A0A7M7Q7B7_NASVI|nr:venom acid phosphatase Acph-1 isoform X2 [Nasonia vitripennis]